jgi:hypothetical protein
LQRINKRLDHLLADSAVVHAALKELDAAFATALTDD